MQCHHCKRELVSRERFCPYCGFPTKKKSEPQEEPDSPVIDLAVFVGDNEDYYEFKWSRMNENGASWNFAAFFLTFGWLGYRKMFKVTAIAAFILLIIDVLLHMFLSIQAANTLSSLITLGLAILFGAFGNAIYQDYSKKKVREIRVSTTNTKEKHALLKKKGGTSVAGIILSMALFMGIYAVPITTLEWLGLDDETEAQSVDKDAAAQEETTWNTYENTRFGYIMDYPGNWTMKEELPDKDGVSFMTADGSITVVYASFFDGEINQQKADITEELHTDEGHLATINKKEGKAAVTYETSMVDDNLAYHLKSTVDPEDAEKFEAHMKEMIKRFKVTEGDVAAIMQSDADTLFEAIGRSALETPYEEATYEQKLILLLSHYTALEEMLAEKLQKINDSPDVLKDNQWISDLDIALTFVMDYADDIEALSPGSKRHQATYELLEELAGEFKKLSALYHEAIEKKEGSSLDDAEAIFQEIENTRMEAVKQLEAELQEKYTPSDT